LSEKRKKKRKLRLDKNKFSWKIARKMRKFDNRHYILDCIVQKRNYIWPWKNTIDYDNNIID